MELPFLHLNANYFVLQSTLTLEHIFFTLTVDNLLFVFLAIIATLLYIINI